MTSFFVPVFERLITFPMFTIAAINGHCFAGAMALAMACDYRVMTDGSERRAWMCMNEIDFGAAPSPYISAIIRSKIIDKQIMRKILSEGHRFTPTEALNAGLIDAVAEGGGTEKVIALATETADKVATHAKMGVWGSIKKHMYRDVLDLGHLNLRMVHPPEMDSLFKARL